MEAGVTPYQEARDLEQRKDELVSPAEYRRILKALADDYQTMYETMIAGTNRLLAHLQNKSRKGPF